MQTPEEKIRSLALKLDVDWDKLSLTHKEAAELCCSKILKDNNIDVDTINDIIDICSIYELPEIEAEAYVTKANIFYEKRDYKEAFLAYNSALDTYKELGIDNDKYFIYNKIGKCKFMTLDYEEALNYFEKCYLYCIEYKDEAYMKHVMYNLCMTYKFLGKVENALEYIGKYIYIFDKEKDFEDYISIIIVKANCYIDIKQYDKAIQLYNDIIPMFNNSTDDLLGYVYHNLGLAYFETNVLNKALQCFNRAIIIRELTDIPRLAHTLFEKSRVYVRLNMYKQAAIHIKSAIKLAKKHNRIQLVLDGYYMLEHIYKQTGDNDLLEKVYLDILELLNGTNKKEEILENYNKLTQIDDKSNFDKYVEYLKNI